MLKTDTHSTEPAELQALVFTAFDGVDVAWEQVVEGESEIELLDLDEAPKTLLHRREIALVKLNRAVSIPQLQLRGRAPGEREPVSMLAFIGGNSPMLLSQGQLLAPGDHAFRYDAYSRRGSSGAPIFDAQWQVLGMHMGSLRPQSSEGFGLGLDTLLALFQRSRHWPDIARYYRLADLLAGSKAIACSGEVAATSSSSVEAALLRAAVSAVFDPASLASEDRDALRHLVVDSAADSWTLQPGVRRNVLDGSVSLAALRDHAAAADDSAAQRMIARILAGPPYALANVPDDELPWWIQGVHWFADVAPDLPAPVQVERALQRRRLRSRLDAIAGDDFLGRDAELQVLREWFAAPRQQPVYVWGIGGVGKSALVARFAQELPASSVLLWLDFDRADIAADDAPSVIAALYAQARLQLDGLDAPVGEIDGARWEQAAEALALALAQAGGSAPMLLVLDSFEVAQHVERYQELWPLLERLARHLPALRIVVSGRAPVPTLSLSGEAAREIPLRGLSTADATTWLARHGVVAQPVVDEVLRLSRGLPLILHLAVQLVDSGGDVDDVPRDLPERIVAGFLYGRILGRIQDAAIKPLAKASLVLRRLSADLLEPIFRDLVDLPARLPSEWIRAFAREVSLVDGEGVLRLRGEIRAPALELLERSERDLVHTIDTRAERWYTALDPREPELAAELVYHRLRLGDVAGAQLAWRDGCGAFLHYATESLPAVACEWLSARLGVVSISDTDLAVWELDAAERIRAARSRGLDRAVGGILAERKERTPGSPLLFHDAFELREKDDAHGALELLTSSPGQAAESVRRDRSMLRALLLTDLGHSRRSDSVLNRWCTSESWPGPRFGDLALAAVRAARIRRNADFEAERELARELMATVNARRRHPGWTDWLSWLDVSLPELDRALEKVARSPSVTQLLVLAADNFQRATFLKTLDVCRQKNLVGELADIGRLRARVLDGYELESSDWPAAVPQSMARMLECAWRRWSIIADRTFLWSFLHFDTTEPKRRLSKSVLGAQALVARTTSLRIVFADGPRQVSSFRVLRQSIETLFGGDKGPEKILVGGLKWLSMYEDDISVYGATDSAASRVAADEVRGRLLKFFFDAEDPLVPLVDSLAGRIRPER
ncbi:trypsin-like peptidase domain-containing protein [Tahibacter sp.]|uniref:trypsin-like peptidase domain-containing protein n=1 Tax=Tahibacter sp. TaxID=2056211 RepID=UPI0028C418F8|nr:trypsin-like peptidase domain-containing protein [Tahibacter sp.]